MGIDSVTFPRMGPIRGQYVFLISKFRDCIHMLLAILFGVTQPLIPLKWLCLLVRKAWRLKRERVKLGSHSIVGVHEGSLYLPYVKIQIFYVFSNFNYYFGYFSFLFP